MGFSLFLTVTVTVTVTVTEKLGYSTQMRLFGWEETEQIEDLERLRLIC